MTTFAANATTIESIYRAGDSIPAGTRVMVTREGTAPYDFYVTTEDGRAKALHSYSAHKYVTQDR